MNTQLDEELRLANEFEEATDARLKQQLHEMAECINAPPSRGSQPQSPTSEPAPKRRKTKDKGKKAVKDIVWTPAMFHEQMPRFMIEWKAMGTKQDRAQFAEHVSEVRRSSIFWLCINY
jgi:hypothetical protein